ncbi:MAG: hypothetical protein A4E53_01640 [Pelotomaculum sp. PtaB.Bin104]|jgi:hypothetical protein|nr:MAG: hypothetical protein A4E53_01640 [Pelotomaculum sp. PtaB.Bin104]
MSPRCEFCPHCKRYYRGKNRKPHCLLMAFCEHPKCPEESGKPQRPRKWIATYRDFLSDKMATSPRWCPYRKHKEK